MTDVQIRSTHPDAFRSGRWAEIEGIEWDSRNRRPCFRVSWPGQVPMKDLWPIADPVAGYEFRRKPLERGPALERVAAKARILASFANMNGAYDDAKADLIDALVDVWPPARA